MGPTVSEAQDPQASDTNADKTAGEANTTERTEDASQEPNLNLTVPDTAAETPSNIDSSAASCCETFPADGGSEDSLSFVSSRQCITVLDDDFAGNSIFLEKVKALKKSCVALRRIKKDGCCFYRSFLFGLFEHYVNHKSEIEKFKQHLQSLRGLITQAGYTMSTVDEFYDEFVESLESLQEESATVSTVENIFSSISTANYSVVFARLLTATHMKLNRELYDPFLVNYPDVESFCRNEVDPMWVEAEQLQVIALTSILNTPIAIHCIDSLSTDSVVLQVFPDQSSIPLVNLLYRPGHYELLYPKNT